jgi:transcriptional regulator NrdR family protein
MTALPCKECQARFKSTSLPAKLRLAGYFFLAALLLAPLEMVRKFRACAECQTQFDTL